MFRGTCKTYLECACFMFLANFTMYVDSKRGCVEVRLTYSENLVERISLKNSLTAGS